MLRSEVRRYAQDRIRPGVAERDAKREFPAEIIAEMGDMGLLGMMVPEEYGGAGFTPLSYVIAVEELAVACPAIAGDMATP